MPTAIKKHKQKLVLFDAHAILHRAYHALPDFVSSKGEPTGGLYGLCTMLVKIVNEFKPDYLVACYDLPKPTFRKEVYKEYKAGRPKADEELVAQMKRSRDVFTAFGVPIYDLVGFEADDIIGTITEKLKSEKDLQIIIASGDMDTLQLVDDDRVVVYTLKKGLTDTVVYNEQAVKDRFGFAPELLADYKGLRGDPSDNIIGIAGIGEKSATDLIVNFGSIENIYTQLKKDSTKLEKAGVKKRIIELLTAGEEEAQFSKMLATIRRDAPIDFNLPEKTWKETFKAEMAEPLLRELDFKSLIARVKAMTSADFSANAEAEKSANETMQASPETIDEQQLKEVSIALWLLDSNLTTPDSEDIYNFAGTRDFSEARKKILAEIKNNKLEKVLNEIELPLIPIIKRAEERGILVDKKYLAELAKDYHARLAELEKKIYDLAGGEFNINSPKQLGELLFDKMQISVKGLKKTAGGARSTRESELLKLKDDYPIIAEILKYRELQKLLSTYIDNLPTLLDADNRLHTSLNQAGTTTGRMSSSNPNLQNIPTGAEFGMAVRRAFITTPGYKLVDFDYSQIEMRVLAILSGDEELIKIFQTGQDVHTSVASLVFGVAPEGVTKEMRRRAKVINFGIIYGMGVNALKVNLGSTRDEAQEFYDNYFAKLPKIRAYFDKVKADAKRLGYTETLFGRRRYFPGLKSPLPFIRAEAERMAMNAPLQGTAADIVKLAMIEVDKSLAKAGLSEQAHLILQIHDELLFEVEAGKVEKAKPIIKEAMESVIKQAVPVTVNYSVGDNWGELKG